MDIASFVGTSKLIARDAARRAGRPDLFDDCQQEALIRIWQANAKSDDRQYLAACGRKAACDVTRNRKLVGMANRSNAGDAFDRAVSSDLVDLDVPDPTAEAAFDGLERQQAARRVAEAMVDLPQRDRDLLRLRFWDELPWSRVGAILGFTSARAAECHWRCYIKPALKERLS